MSEDRRVTDIDDGAERRFAALARTVTPADRQRLTPPDDLWAAIERAATDSPRDASVRGEAQSAHGTASPPVSAAPAHRRGLVASIDSGTQSPAAGNVIPLHRRTSALLLSAAAAVLLVLGVVAIVVSTGDDAPSGDLVATGDLEPLAEGFEGGVELVEVGGRLELDLEVGALPDASNAYYELWLIKDLETGEMQSLGPVDGSGRVDLPAGLDPTQYATVDISIEPLDGVPTHSGQSVLRGTLDI